MIDFTAIAPTLQRKLRHGVGRAIADFNLIQAGDRIAIAVSGGKDSVILARILSVLRHHAPIQYDLVPIMIDMGFGQERAEATAREALAQCGLELVVERTDSASVIEEHRRPDSSYCSFCARLKRGALYGAARRLHCNILALGHHQDDFIETLLLNQFFIGTIKAMAAKTLCDTGDITVIRPLVYVSEAHIIEAARQAHLKTGGCECPMAGPDQQRQKMKRLIHDLSADIPHIKESLLAALGNIQPRHLLDTRLTDLLEAQK